MRMAGRVTSITSTRPAAKGYMKFGTKVVAFSSLSITVIEFQTQLQTH